MLVASFHKEYAKVRGRVASSAPDVYATAADQGTLHLRITPLLACFRRRMLQFLWRLNTLKEAVALYTISLPLLQLPSSYVHAYHL